MAEVRKFDAAPGERLDVFLCEKLDGTTRGFVRKLLDRGLVRVSGRDKSPGYKLKEGEIVELQWGETTVDSELKVLLEDDRMLMIEKPSGLIVHPVGETWLHTPEAALHEPEATVVSWLLRHRPGAEDLERCGLVHRLDRETSGVMAVAKTAAAQKELMDQFRDRLVQKTYLAVVTGSLPKAKGIIDAPVGRVEGKLTATPYGKEATSSYKVLKTSDRLSLVEVRPKTGRTHQIRVHLQAVGCPVLGDLEHGGEKADRLYLHAHRLKMKLGGKPVQGVSPAPAEFDLEGLRP